jgi:tetratricopeptide (TPR) repeat protein
LIVQQKAFEIGERKANSQEGWKIRRTEGRALLILPALAIVFVALFIAAASGYCGPCDTCCNGSAREQAEQRHWTVEAYRFLYSDQYYTAFATAYQAHKSIPAPAQNRSQSLEEGTFQYWLAKGNEQYIAGSYEGAVAAYGEALKLDNQTEIWLNLGNSLYFLGRYQEALNYYNATLAANPQDENAWQGKAQSLLSLNRTTDAYDAQRTLDVLKARNITSIGSAKSPVVVWRR